MKKKSKITTLILIIVGVAVVMSWFVLSNYPLDRCQRGIKDHLISQYKNPVTGQTKIFSNLPGCQQNGYELDTSVIVD